MRRPILPVALVCVLGTLLVGAPVALGSTHAHNRHAHSTARAQGNAASTEILKECQSSGQLTHTFSKADLRLALSVMSAEIKQYTNCYDVVHQALINDVTVSGKAPAPKSSGGSSLSTPVIIVIVVVVLAAVVFGGLAIRRRRGGGSGQPPVGGPGGPPGAGPGGSPGAGSGGSPGAGSGGPPDGEAPTRVAGPGGDG